MHDQDLGLGLGRDRLLGGISVSAETNFKAIFDQKSILNYNQKKNNNLNNLNSQQCSKKDGIQTLENTQREKEGPPADGKQIKSAEESISLSPWREEKTAATSSPC